MRPAVVGEGVRADVFDAEILGPEAIGADVLGLDIVAARRVRAVDFLAAFFMRPPTGQAIVRRHVHPL